MPGTGKKAFDISSWRRNTQACLSISVIDGMSSTELGHIVDSQLLVKGGGGMRKRGQHSLFFVGALLDASPYIHNRVCP